MAQAKESKTVEQKFADAGRDAVTRPETSVMGTVEYRPETDLALPEAGEVALDNWVGRIGNNRVRVYRGALAKKIPGEVIKAMQGSDCRVGRVTWADLGMRPPEDVDRPRRGRRVEAPPSSGPGGF